MKREGTSNLPFPAWTGVILTLFLILMDQVTKLLALSQLKGNPDIILIPGVLQLKYLENRGMAFGMLQGKIPLLIALCLLFFCVFLVYFILKSLKHGIIFLSSVQPLFWRQVLLEILIDRVFRGYVIDFIYFSLIDFSWYLIWQIFMWYAAAYFSVFCVCFKYKD